MFVGDGKMGKKSVALERRFLYFDGFLDNINQNRKVF
jgi:hypothetical protein